MKVARGSDAEHLAAASVKPAKLRKRALSKAPRKEVKSRPRPSREKLDLAERALETLDEEHGNAVDDLINQAADLKRRLAAVETQQRELDLAHERNRKVALEAIDRERKRHSEALDEWLAAQP